MTSPDRRALILGLAAAALAPRIAPAVAADADPLDEHLWEKRPVIVFAPSENDPRFRQQMRALEERREALEERDVVVITDTTPGPSRFDTTPLREKFRPHDFNLLVVGKDGEVKLRRPGPQSADQIIRLIDRLPLRKQEVGR
ncbi:MAG TPA: DUF4174 domain-containing protein [Paracoccaceae bacterium]|nr:DUF4174 domain-containing protein [Paracoccaceae bacterium]